MSRPVTLRLLADPGLAVDMTGVLPERLAGLGEAEVAALPVRVGNRLVPLGELFRVTPGDDPYLIVEDSARRLDRLGAGMVAGTLEAYGDVGAYLGLHLRGGRIVATGSAGDFVGAEMRGGTIAVRADAGAFLGAHLPGSAQGMAGGSILVDGSAGDRAGDRMRRGLIAVGGRVGDYAAARMIGGTLLARGGCGVYPGYAMRRGSLLLARGPATALQLFADNGLHDLPWLGLLGRHLAGLGWQQEPFPSRVRHLTGDVTGGGKGEMLVGE